MKLLSKIINKSIYLITSFWGRLKLKMLGVKFGSGLKLFGVPLVSVQDSSEIHIGQRVVLCSSSKRTALGVNHPVILRTLTPGAKIIIGDDVGVSGATICAAKSIYIGNKTMFGANVTVADTDFHPISPNNRRYNNNFNDIKSKDVVIGENVFIGANAVILKGVVIGKNSIIGAGSIVTTSIPENVIAAGNPCKVISELNK